MVITSIAAPFADNLISSGVDTTKVNHCLEDEKGINKTERETKKKKKRKRKKKKRKLERKT